MTTRVEGFHPPECPGQGWYVCLSRKDETESHGTSHTWYGPVQQFIPLPDTCTTQQAAQDYFQRIGASQYDAEAIVKRHYSRLPKSTNSVHHFTAIPSTPSSTRSFASSLSPAVQTPQNEELALIAEGVEEKVSNHPSGESEEKPSRCC